MKKLELILVLLFISTILISSCKGPEGPIGPAGPTGPKGDQGPAGPKGNANVVTLTVAGDTANWDFNGQYFENAATTYSLVDTLISEDIVNNGAILGYMTVDETNWNTLPMTVPVVDAGFMAYLTYTHKIDTIDIFAYTDQDMGLPDDMLNDIVFRFVLVGGSTSSDGSRIASGISLLDAMKADGVDTSDYFEVCHYLGIDPVTGK